MLQKRNVSKDVVAVTYDAAVIYLRQSGRAHYGEEEKAVSIKDGKIIIDEAVAHRFGLDIEIVNRQA